jgi:adiponectin receptor
VNEGIERARRTALVLEHIQQAILQAKERGLLVYEEVPAAWRNNPYIKRVPLL